MSAILQSDDDQTARGTAEFKKARSMTIKDNYTAEEWDVLQRALYAPAYFIIAAEPGGRRELASESMAMGQYYGELTNQAQRDELDNATLAAMLLGEGAAHEMPKTADGSTDYPALRERSLDTLRQANAILTAKAPPDDAARIRQVWQDLAGATAAAAKEGSRFGMGGKRVTDAERAALAELAALLGTAA